jgi:uncharacterized membrane protein YczE
MAPMRTRLPSPHVYRRLPALVIGLALFGLAIGLLVRADLGLNPWEVLHQGISEQTGLPMGTVAILLGLPIIALWLPLGERPGIGTVLNVLIVGSSVNVALAYLPEVTGPGMQVAAMVAGIALYGLATGMYLSADMGPGPRDGLMTAIHHRYGWRIAPVRTGIEIVVLGVGWAWGGTVGVGTIVFAFAIGPLTELSLRVFDRDGRVLRRRLAQGAEPIPAEGAA